MKIFLVGKIPYLASSGRDRNASLLAAMQCRVAESQVTTVMKDRRGARIGRQETGCGYL
jgi:hypothetical protein